VGLLHRVVMDETTARKSVADILTLSKGILDTAKTAKRNRQSLAGSGFYGNKFHEIVVKLITLEKLLAPVFNDIKGLDPATLTKNLHVLCSVGSDGRARDAAYKNLRLICETEVLTHLANLNVPETPTNEGVLPSSVILKAPNYLQRIVIQINGCYERRWYDACSVMLRKLVESLIIEVYEKCGKGDEIKKDGDYLMLSGLVHHILNVQKYWSLQRETKRELPDLKKLGDRAAHNRRYQATKQDIEQIRSGLRVTVDDLLHLADLK
jgi:hypothetical protein